MIIQAANFRILDAGFWRLDAGKRGDGGGERETGLRGRRDDGMPDAGYRMLDTGCWMLANLGIGEFRNLGDKFRNLGIE